MLPLFYLSEGLLFGKSYSATKTINVSNKSHQMLLDNNVILYCYVYSNQKKKIII